MTQTKSYKSVIAPLVERLQQERDAIIERLKITRGKAKYRDLIDGFDKVTKNIQLLTGGATENSALLIGFNAEEKENAKKAIEQITG